jgi:hypothetical protein
VSLVNAGPGSRLVEPQEEGGSDDSETTYDGADLRLRVLRQLELPPPKGLASWDGASLAALGASDDAVWRLLRREGVQLRRRRLFGASSTEPQFTAKAAEPPQGCSG